MNPKPNNCKQNFICIGWSNCAYRMGKKCDYMTADFKCVSKVAQANAMVLKLKEMGLY